MDEQLYTPQEIADILKIKKTTVYDMIKRGELGAVKMGKQLRVPDSDLKRFLNKGESNQAKVKEDEYAASGQYSKPVLYNARNSNIVVCGQDIVLDMLCSSANSKLGVSCFLRSYAGSYDGILSLYNDEVHVASAHLWDKDTDTYNLPFIKYMLPGEQVSVYHVLKRPVCIYTQLGNPKGITSIKDFARNDVTIVNRERGSGIRVLIDSLMYINGILPSQVNGYNRIVNSHLAAASIISRGGADCSIGTQTAAFQFNNIEKIFLRYEEYDIVLRKADEELPEVKVLLEILASERFREEVGAMGGYDVTDMGKKIL